MSNKTLLTALAATATLFIADESSAYLLNADLFATTTNNAFPSDAGVMSGAAATGSAGDVWNDVEIAPLVASTFGGLVDSTGAAVAGASIGFDGNHNWGTAVAPDAAYGGAGVLMADYLVPNAFNGSTTFTITVPEANTDYTLYLYGVTNFAPQDSRFTVAGANEGAQTVTSPDISGPLTVIEDYVVFTGSTNASGEIVVTVDSATSDFYAINGFQLDVVPEPSSLALLCLGGLMIAPRRRS